MTEEEIAAFPDVSLQPENDVSLQMSSKDYLLTGSPQVGDCIEGVCIMDAFFCLFVSRSKTEELPAFLSRETFLTAVVFVAHFGRPHKLEMYALVCVTVEALVVQVLSSATRRCGTTTWCSIWRRRRLAGAL